MIEQWQLCPRHLWADWNQVLLLLNFCVHGPLNELMVLASAAHSRLMRAGQEFESGISAPPHALLYEQGTITLEVLNESKDALDAAIRRLKEEKRK